MTSPGIPYQKSLDGIRGFAILLVMLTHQLIINFGWTGVQLFFVLSGYLITKILFEEKEKQIPVKSKLKNFWMRRVLRIFPVYYLYIFILLIIWLTVNHSPDFLNEIPFLFTYTYNFYLSATLDFFNLPVRHLWSLSVEEQFYLFYPFLVLLLRRQHLKISILILIVFSVLFRIFYLTELKSLIDLSPALLMEKTHYLTFSHFDSFLAGAVIVVFRLNRIKTGIQNLLFVSSVLCLFLGGLFLFTRLHGWHFCITCYLSDFGFVFTNLTYQWPYLVLNFFFFSLILILTVEQKGQLHFFINKIFSFQLLVAVGKVSYGMYVIHLGISSLFDLYRNWFDFISNKYLLFILYAIIVYGAALILYKGFEKNFLMLKDRFR